MKYSKRLVVYNSVPVKTDWSLDKEINTILHNSSLSMSEKIKLYTQALEQFKIKNNATHESFDERKEREVQNSNEKYINELNAERFNELIQELRNQKEIPRKITLLHKTQKEKKEKPLRLSLRDRKLKKTILPKTIDEVDEDEEQPKEQESRVQSSFQIPNINEFIPLNFTFGNKSQNTTLNETLNDTLNETNPLNENIFDKSIYQTPAHKLQREINNLVNVSPPKSTKRQSKVPQTVTFRQQLIDGKGLKRWIHGKRYF